MKSEPPSDDDLDLVVDHHQQQAEAAGHPPRHLEAWRAACRRDLLDNERVSPGHVARAAAGLRVRADGKRITYWTEVRGTHGLDWLYDPTGVATPPEGYNLATARAEYEQRRITKRPQTPRRTNA